MVIEKKNLAAWSRHPKDFNVVLDNCRETLRSINVQKNLFFLLPLLQQKKAGAGNIYHQFFLFSNFGICIIRTTSKRTFQILKVEIVVS